MSYKGSNTLLRNGLANYGLHLARLPKRECLNFLREMQGLFQKVEVIVENVRPQLRELPRELLLQFSGWQ